MEDSKTMGDIDKLLGDSREAEIRAKVRNGDLISEDERDFLEGKTAQRN